MEDNKAQNLPTIANLFRRAIGDRTTTDNIIRAILVTIIGGFLWGADQLNQHGIIQIGCASCEERLEKLETIVDKHKVRQELFENRVNDFIAKGKRVTPDMLEDSMNVLRREHVRSVRDTKEDVLELKKDVREIRNNLYRLNGRE